MRLISVLIITLVSLLFLTSCGSTVPQKQAAYNFQTGISELNWKFLTNSPPEKIYPYSGFKMILMLDNQAAYPLTNGKVSIVGLDGKYFQLDQLEQNFEPLDGRNLENPLGGQDQLEFSGTAGGLFSSAEEYQGNYFLMLNYNSKVDFVDTVCMNSHQYDTYDSGCKSNLNNNYPGQGAPLAVTQMEQISYPTQEANGGEVEFRLRVQNRGRGKVLNATLVEAKIGGEDLYCSFDSSKEQKNSGLNDNKQETMLFCKTSVKQDYSYTTPLLISLSYKYALSERQRLWLVK
ncbi:MAG: hypothetical protein WCV90_03665 [Candidatus Woesearchaeota archaeon]